MAGDADIVAWKCPKSQKNSPKVSFPEHAQSGNSSVGNHVKAPKILLTMDWKSIGKGFSGVALGACVIVLLPMPARPEARSYKVPEMLPESSRDLEAYIGPVRAVREARINGYFEGDAGRIRQASQVWIAGLRSGKLKSVPSVSELDTTRDGAKFQVVEARRVLAGALTWLARQSLKNGRPDLAAQDFAAAVEVLEAFKYSDLISLPPTLSQQNSILREATTAHLTHYHAIRESVKSLKPWKEHFDLVASAWSRATAYLNTNVDGIATGRLESGLTLASEIRAMQPSPTSIEQTNKKVSAENFATDQKMLLRLSLNRSVVLYQVADPILKEAQRPALVASLN